MTELKTLKDIVEEYKGKDTIDFDFTLKQEAIKRIKYHYEEREKAFDNDRWRWINQGRIAELMDFFNITEEDLK